MGIVAGGRLKEIRTAGPFLVLCGIILPLVHGFLGILIGKYTELSLGGTTLMGVLAASASYIAAPAAIRLSLPEANPVLYLTSSLAVTFPSNVTLGIPIHYSAACYLLE